MNNYFTTRELCPTCNEKKHKILHSSPYSDSHIKGYLNRFYSEQGGQIEFDFLEDANYTIARCNNCETIFQKEIPNDFLMKKLYENWINAEKVFELYESNYPKDYYQSYASMMYKVISILNKRPNEIKVFDFGMGWGNWSLMAKAFGCDSYGSELSDARIKHARSCGIKVLSYEDIPNHKFDFINTDQVFEHIPNPLETLKYLSNSLNAGGIIRISVPNGRKINKLARKIDWSQPKNSPTSFNAIAPLEHINCFNNSSLKYLGESAELKAVNLPYFPKSAILKSISTFFKEIGKSFKSKFGMENSKSTDLFFKKGK